jgi:hypothetical protein
MRTAADRRAEAARYQQMTEQAQAAARTIPVAALRYCRFNRDQRTLAMSSRVIGMPREFMVESHYTGKQVRFVAVGPEDRLFDQDGWDGEQCIYRPVGHVPNVDYMVISHCIPETPARITLQEFA